MSWICTECGLENTDDTNNYCYCGFSRDDIPKQKSPSAFSQIMRKMDTRITFIKIKYLIIVGVYWGIFFRLSIHFNGGYGEITNRYSFLMLVLGNGGVAIVTGLSLINKMVQKNIVREGMEFKYGGLLFLFFLMSVSTVFAVSKLLN